MSEPDAVGRPPRPAAAGHRFAVRRRAVDRPPRTAAVARALARPAPGVATAVLCLLAVLAGAGHAIVDDHARAAAHRAHPHHRRHARASHRRHHRHRRPHRHRTRH